MVRNNRDLRTVVAGVAMRSSQCVSWLSFGANRSSAALWVQLVLFGCLHFYLALRSAHVLVKSQLDGGAIHDGIVFFSALARPRRAAWTHFGSRLASWSRSRTRRRDVAIDHQSPSRAWRSRQVNSSTRARAIFLVRRPHHRLRDGVGRIGESMLVDADHERLASGARCIHPRRAAMASGQSPDRGAVCVLRSPRSPAIVQLAEMTAERCYRAVCDYPRGGKGAASGAERGADDDWR